MVEFNLGKVNTVDNIKKNLSGIAEGIVDYSYYSGVGSPSRTAEDLQLTEEDIKGFVKRRKAAIKKQKKDGALGLTKTIIAESYNPRFSLDYNEKLPILPGLYTQSNTAIKDKLIDEQLNITQQKEDYKAALSNKAPPNLGLMSPRELLKSLNTSDFTPISPTGLIDGPVTPPPDKPTDANNLPFFSLTGPSEKGPTAGGILRFLGPAQFTNPLVKPPGSLGSGFGFNLKGLAGKSDEFITKELITNIKKNASKEEASVFDEILTEASIFVDELPTNTASVQKLLANKTNKKLPQVKDLQVSKTLEDLEVIETDGARQHEHVTYNMDIFNNQSAYDKLNRNESNVGSFAITDSVKGVGLQAKGVPTPYSTKSYAHLEVVTDKTKPDPDVGSVIDEPMAALYGHKRVFMKKEIPEGFPSIQDGPDIVDKAFKDIDSKKPGQFVSNQTPAGLRDVPYSDVAIDGNPLDIHKHYIYNNITQAKDKGMIPPADKVTLQRVGDRSVYDTSGILNNYDSDIIIEEFPRELFDTDEFDFRQLLYREGPEWRKFNPEADLKAGTFNNKGQLVTTDNAKLRSQSIDKQRQFAVYKDFLDFKVEMQKLDALLKLVKVPNILDKKEVAAQYYNRMTIQDVVEFFDKTPIEKNLYAAGGMLIDGKHAFLTDYIRTYAKTAINNSFNREPLAVRDELENNIRFSVNKTAIDNWIDEYLSKIDLRVYPHTTTSSREFLKLGDPEDTDVTSYRHGDPIKAEDLKKYMTRVAKIQYQKAIIDNPPSLDAGKRKPGMYPTFDLQNLDEGTGEFFDAINIKPYMFETLEKWQELRGQQHLQIHHIPESSAFGSFADKRTELLQDIEYKWGPGKVREYIVEEQFDTFSGKKDIFGSSKDILEGMKLTKEGISKDTAALLRGSTDESFSRFLQGEDLNEGIVSLPPSAAEKAFSYFMKHPESLVELTTVHNVKQALENTNLDAVRFNTFATATKFQGWAGDLSKEDNFKLMMNHLKNASEDVKSLARQLYSPDGPMQKENNVASKIFNKKDLIMVKKLKQDNSQAGVISDFNLSASLEMAQDSRLMSTESLDRPSSGTVEQLRDIRALEKLDGVGDNYGTYLPNYGDFQEASKALQKIKEQAKYMTAAGLTPKPIQQFRVYEKMRAVRLRMFQILDNEFKAMQFGATKDTPIFRRLIENVYEESSSPLTKEDFDEFTFAFGFSPEANAYIMSHKDGIENFGSSMMSFMNMKDHFKPAPLLQALNMLNFNLTSMTSFYKRVENANPLFSKPFGLLSDEVLTNTVKNAKSGDKTKLIRMAFANQYDKYKLSALDKLGLNYKIVNEFTDAEKVFSVRNDERNLSFYEVELPKNINERLKLLDKIKSYEVKLFSQYMPIPNFEERSEEEMGAT